MRFGTKKSDGFYLNCRSSSIYLKDKIFTNMGLYYYSGKDLTVKDLTKLLTLADLKMINLIALNLFLNLFKSYLKFYEALFND